MFGLGSGTQQKQRFEKDALRYVHQLYATARRLTRSEADAEDLVQDTYLRAYSFFDSFREGTNLRAWLFKIMTNLFINRYRRRATEARVLAAGREDSGVPLLSPAPVVPSEPEAGLHGGQFGDDVQRALDALNEDFRLVVLLADLHDFSYKEIAEILDCPVGTVMSRLFRGRRALQVSLLGYANARGIGLGQGAARNTDLEREGLRAGA